MLRKTLLAGAALMLAATPALAFHCPKDAKAIEAGLAKSSLGGAQKAEIAALKDQGMSLHGAGKHDEGQKVLADAMRRLLTGM